jgi:hypothetical protein
MARYRVSRAPRRAPERPSALAVALNYILTIIFIVAGIGMLILIAPILYTRYAGAATNPQPPSPIPQLGNVGGQAPPSVRGSYADSPAIAATPIPGIAQNAAEAERMYLATAQAASGAPEAATPVPFVPAAAPLPLNSAGQPIIDETQQQQLDFSAQMAADEQQAAIRAAQLADAAARAPDVSYADAAAELHRDPCHVPRADPATCARGLFKPTPVQP